MCSSGECFIVQTPYCAEKTVIFGRNSLHEDTVGKAQEVIYYDASMASDGKCDGGADVEVIGSLRMILQKPLPGVWGGDYGANEKNVCVGITWSGDEPDAASGHLLSTDIVRYTLAAATSAVDAIEQIGSLVSAHSTDKFKSGYVVCDALEAWLVSCYGKLWAAHRFTEGFRCFPSDSLGTYPIDKSSENLADSLKELGLWNGEDDINLAACCNAASRNIEDVPWCGDKPKGDGSYSLMDMFATLRASSKNEIARSATVSVLTVEGISCHWFTATPMPAESVFKPFVFAPNPKISPLTRVPAGDTITLLHKLHAQRKANAINDLKRLEVSCVNEMNSYLEGHPSPNEELDELMKDCVEAEVKFYR